MSKATMTLTLGSLLGGGVLLLFGVGNLVGLELPESAWWAKVAAIPGVLVLGALGGLLLVAPEKALWRVVGALLFCAGCAAEAVFVGIGFLSDPVEPVWEGGIPNWPRWAAILSTCFGGILAFIGILYAVSEQEYD